LAATRTLPKGGQDAGGPSAGALAGGGEVGLDEECVDAIRHHHLAALVYWRTIRDLE
jgi:hypothetical protein